MAVQLLTVPRSTLWSDDLIWFQLARDIGFNRHLLVRPLNGHLVPAFQAANWAYWQVFGMAWWPAACLMIALWGACVAVFHRIALRLTGHPGAAAFAALFFALSPIPVASTTWWSAGISLITSLLGGLLTIAVFLRWDRTRHRGLLLLMSLVFLGALLFWEKAVVAAPEIALLSVLLVDHGLTVRERLRRACGRWPAWLALGVPAAVYMWAYLRPQYSGASPPPGNWHNFISFMRVGTLETLVPALTGLRPIDLETADLDLWMLLVTWGAAAVAVAWILLTRRGTAPGWLFLAIGVLGNFGLTAYGRSGLGSALAADFRYHLDSLMVVCLALAWMWARPRKVRGPRWLVLAGVAGYAAAATWTAPHVLSQSTIPISRTILDRFQHDYDTKVQGSGLPILDLFVRWPPVLAPFPYDHASKVLSLYHPEARFSTRDERGWVMQGDGHLALGRLKGTETQPTGRSCTSPGAEPIVYPVSSAAFGGGDALAIRFRHADATAAVVTRIGGNPVFYLTPQQGTDLSQAEPSLLAQPLMEYDGWNLSPRSFDDIAVYSNRGEVCVSSLRYGPIADYVTGTPAEGTGSSGAE